MTFLTQDVMSGTSWKSLEKAVARMMSHCGWHDVRIIGQTGDRGGDILSCGGPKDPSTSYVVQVKSTKPGYYVGSEAIDEVWDAMATYGAHKGVVATNGTFRDSAIKRKDRLATQGFSIKLWNGAFLKTLVGGTRAQHAHRRTPREYQQPIIDSLLSDAKNKVKRMHFVLATGLGKSLIAAETVRGLWSDLGFRRILVVCHMKDLADQLERSFWSQLDKDIVTSTFYEGQDPKLSDGINFGIFQTLANKLDLIEPGFFDAIVVDEAHHAPAASYLNCLNRLQPKLLLGMTATPWSRVEGAFDEVFGKRIAEISLPEGMRMGYLATVKYVVHCDNIRWEEMNRLAGQDVSVKDLNKKLFIPQRDEAIAQEILKVCGGIRDPRVCVFCPSIEHGRRFARLLQSKGLPCRELSGVDKPQRWRSLMDFGSGKIKAVTAVDVLNEGIDVPDVNVVVFLRVTHSHRIFIQQLGRGLRLSDHKTEVAVLDFVTDIRRIAAVLRIDKGYRTSDYKDVTLKDEIRFTSQKARMFIEQWFEELENVASKDEEETLRFPSLESLPSDDF